MEKQNRHLLKLRTLKTVSPSVKGQAKKEIYLLAKRIKKKMFVSSCRSGETIKLETSLRNHNYKSALKWV